MTALPSLPKGKFQEPPEAERGFDRAPIPRVAGTRRILVVDDDSLVRASLGAVLESEGFDVVDAGDGPAAIRATVQYEPDLVLLDLSMPGLDGWTTFARMEGLRPLVPVVVITARPNQYPHAVRLGVDAFMEKPLNLPVLLRTIRRLTNEPERRHARRVTNPRFVTLFLESRPPAQA